MSPASPSGPSALGSDSPTWVSGVSLTGSAVRGLVEGGLGVLLLHRGLLVLGLVARLLVLDRDGAAVRVLVAGAVVLLPARDAALGRVLAHGAAGRCGLGVGISHGSCVPGVLAGKP